VSRRELLRLSIVVEDGFASVELVGCSELRWPHAIEGVATRRIVGPVPSSEETRTMIEVAARAAEVLVRERTSEVAGIRVVDLGHSDTPRPKGAS
jgi:hypothetical protein